MKKKILNPIHAVELYKNLSNSYSKLAGTHFYVFYQICERSLTGAQGGPTIPPVQSFIRAEMLPSGYLIRPCDGGGCIIHIVDHVDLEVHPQ